MIWTDEMVEFLKVNYPAYGKDWCVKEMGLTEAQIRQKASRLQLKARGVSEAWHRKQKEHAILLTGRKRPDQAELMRELRRSGAIKMSEEGKKLLSEAVKKRFKEKGHPRGALGMKHSNETKKIISEKSKQSWMNKTEDQLEKHSKMASENGRKASPINREGASWKAGWREIGGYKKYYRSRWEANYARYLEHLRSNGLIRSWLHEPVTFWFEGIKRGCMSYLPDFEVIENSGRFVYHEVKGWMDDRSKTKIKRMAKYHPEIELVVIGSKEYRELDKKCKCLLEGWE